MGGHAGFFARRICAQYVNVWLSTGRAAFAISTWRTVVRSAVGPRSHGKQPGSVPAQGENRI